MSVPGWLGQTPLHLPVPDRPGAVLAGRVEPFSAAELEAAWSEWSSYSPLLADVLLVLARTGLRWDEARRLTVADAGPDHLRVRGPRQRCVPVAVRIRPIVERLLAGRDDDEVLFTTSTGEPLSRTDVLDRLHWDRTGRGRRLVDLRHTAAFLWLAEGACPAAVREWMGGR
ncbi:tyrosine-type recombinase/integrase [Propionicimonas sp.]|uniref:tyrosine-type recombinase/integrase n=1 Tax=Propionicimonas sp. TaxID=1955623 RepID=UPI0039E54E95